MGTILFFPAGRTFYSLSHVALVTSVFLSAFHASEVEYFRTRSFNWDNDFLNFFQHLQEATVRRINHRKIYCFLLEEERVRLSISQYPLHLQ